MQNIDEDEDFATFIANRRLCDKTDKTRANHTANEQRTHSRRHLPKPIGGIEDTESNATLFQDCFLENFAPTDEREGTRDTQPSNSSSQMMYTGREEAPIDPQLQETYSGSNASNIMYDSAASGASPEPQCFSSQFSPLFVQQLPEPKPALVPASQSKQCRGSNRIVLADHDSDVESLQLGRARARHRSTSQISGLQRRGAAGKSTIRDPFTNPDYMNLIKQNPYTSGLLMYQKSAEEKATSKHNVKRVSETQPVKNMTASTTTWRRQPKISRPTDSHHNENQPSQTRPSKRRRLHPTQPDIAAKSGSKRPMASAVTPSALSLDALHVVEPRPLVHQQNAQDLDEVAPVQRLPPDITRLSMFLRQNTLRYGNGLAKLGCRYTIGSEVWQMLAQQIQPSVDMFGHQLVEEQNLSVQDVIARLQAWDVDMGVRAILQKYIMYAALLERVES